MKPKRANSGDPRTAPALTIVPLTEDRWPDFEQLFGTRGACGGCWCMAWRLPRGQWEKGKGAGNRRAMRARVAGGPPPGLLAYEGGRPAGWVSVAPREEFPRLGASRVLAPVDARPVWSVTCFFIAKGHRGRGVSVALLRAAVAFVRERGGKRVEGYPYDVAPGALPGPFVWTGLASAFRAAGFQEVARRSKSRPIFQCETGA